MKQCENINPGTGMRCTMAEGHFGPHRVGDVYHPTEQWVEKCKTRKCDFHLHSHDHTYQCIYCGDSQPGQIVACPSCGEAVDMPPDWDGINSDEATCERCQEGLR